MRKKGKIVDSETVLCIVIGHIFRVFRMLVNALTLLLIYAIIIV